MVYALALLATLALHGSQALPDGAAIVNSGSTNTAAWRIGVRSDGFAELRVRGSAQAPATLAVPVSLARALLRDARLARSARLIGRPCMKSASFGSRLTLTYHGWESPDLSCPRASSLESALAADVRQVVGIAHVPAAPLRRIRIPLEPRRVPTEAPEPQGL